MVFFPVQSNAAEIEAMRSGRLHIAGVSTGPTPIAVNCAGYVPFAIMGTQGGTFGYEMEIIVPADSPIKTPADLKGKKVAFTAPTSNSGFKAPSAILKSEFNLKAERDFTPVFSGKHDNSVLGVANKDYDAAAIANEVMFRMFERKVVDKAKIRTIYKSETFPTTSYGMAHNLDPALAAKIKEAFFTFPWEGSALKAEFKTEDRFVPITYQKDWSVIRKIDAATRREIHVQVNASQRLQEARHAPERIADGRRRARGRSHRAVRRGRRAGRLPARHARQGLLRPQRRSRRRPADRPEEDRSIRRR